MQQCGFFVTLERPAGKVMTPVSNATPTRIVELEDVSHVRAVNTRTTIFGNHDDGPATQP